MIKPVLITMALAFTLSGTTLAADQTGTQTMPDTAGQNGQSMQNDQSMQGDQSAQSGQSKQNDQSTQNDQSLQNDQSDSRSQAQAMTDEARPRSNRPETVSDRGMQSETWTSPGTAAANQRNYEASLQDCKKTDDPATCVELVQRAFGQL